MITDVNSLRGWLSAKYDSNIEMRFLDLYNMYMCYPSVKRDANKLEVILRYNNVTNRQIEKILREYIPSIVSPTIKNLILGNIIASIIDIISSFNSERYEVEFNKNYEYKFTDIPNWYIRDKQTEKIIIGYNHYDIRKGSKYIMDNELHEKYSRDNIIVINVVFSVSYIIDNIAKCYDIMKYGINTNRICYISDLVRTVNCLLEN